MARERRRIYYSGRVQGVGFRFTAERLAQRRAVSGWVRNLDDGRVEVVAEGEPAEVDALLDAIGQAMRGKVHSVESVTEPPGDPPLDDFSIRY
jgi:acylphosphatase